MYYKTSIEKTSEHFNVDPQVGLSSDQAKKRLEENGLNELKQKPGKTILQMLWGQINEPMIYILLAAATVSGIMKDWVETTVIFAIIIINAVIGIIQENKAGKALEALKKLTSPICMVRRDEKVIEIPASQLVCGDIVILEAGRVIPADLRLSVSINLKIEESTLTGESVPVDKDIKFISQEDVPLGDRLNMAYQATAVTYGRGEGIVVATGMNTEIGHIAGIIDNEAENTTPLQRRLSELGKILGIIALAICFVIFVIGILEGNDLKDMFLTAISLAVAAIPEGLPAVVTIVLALGVTNMVKHNTIIRKLPAVETLGSVNVVCSDKTGTLTQNRMTVTKFYIDGETKPLSDLDKEVHRLLIEGFVLCNDADNSNGQRIGDPTEIALLDMAKVVDLHGKVMEKDLPRIDELPFDSDRKMMTTLHKFGEGTVSYTKGALDKMIPHFTQILENGVIRDIADQDIERFEKGAADMANNALRVLALAMRKDDEKPQESELIFIGLVGMIDPPRPEVAESIQVCGRAGITVVMITGDHKNTAFAIGKEIGIADSLEQTMSGDELDELNDQDLADVISNIRIFARVSPQHKVRIIKALKDKGNTVSMTGDGVNDAPSLKAADIGVAMGITGTDVAKGAADMILTDDKFSTIQKAVEEGRNIYNNIRKTTLFLLSSNFGEIFTMLSVIIVDLFTKLPIPLLPLHILWINLVTDSLPALALGVDTGDPRVMDEKPRNKKDSMFAHGGWSTIFLYGFVIAAATVTAFFIPMLLGKPFNEAFSGMSLVTARTCAFATLAISQLFHAFGIRNLKVSIFKMNYTKNKFMISAFFIAFGLQLAVMFVPFLQNIFKTAGLTLVEFGLVMLVSISPLVVHEIVVLGNKLFKK